ncbi:MAG: hypothetical protein AAFR55_07065 [Pseudomonadota bacterium]
MPTLPRSLAAKKAHSFGRRIAACGVALTLTVSAASPAFAQAQCATYGKLSLQQQRQNVQKSCNFAGPSWSTDLRKHIKWCASVGPDQWKAELQKRAKMLTECG